MLTLTATVQQLIGTAAAVSIVPLLTVGLALMLSRTLRLFSSSWDGKNQ